VTGNVGFRIDGRGYSSAAEVLEQPERTMPLVQITASGSRNRYSDVMLSNRPFAVNEFPGTRQYVAITGHEPQKNPHANLGETRAWGTVAAPQNGGIAETP
jgi:hypothetical protein